MTGRTFSLILLPTLRCNAQCEYCFEDKSGPDLTLDQLRVLIRKVMDYMGPSGIETLYLYWQGGEIMTLPPHWFERAHDIIQEIASAGNTKISHYLQSNMIAYGRQWNSVISGMFGGSVGTSMDFPNLYRRCKGIGPEEFEKIWARRVREARSAGFEVGTIAIPSEATLESGAERFYSYFVDDLGIKDFQVNTPFPGGALNVVKQGFPLKSPQLMRFLVDLAEIWLERGFHNGVRVGPFGRFLDYFVHGTKDFLCVWRENCANEFVCIDPGGHVAQCDCWVTSYPEFSYGNIFGHSSLWDLLEKSVARQMLRDRPGRLIQREDCLECDYLSLCHGGCPVRAYSVYGDVFRKDPYCELYKELFPALERMASRVYGPC